MKMEELIELVEIQLGKKKVKASDHFINDLELQLKTEVPNDGISTSTGLN